MGTKYCPNCKKVVMAKVIGKYSQVEFKGIPVKRRKIVHLESDGGCGHERYTVEIAVEVLRARLLLVLPQRIKDQKELEEFGFAILKMNREIC